MPLEKKDIVFEQLLERDNLKEYRYTHDLNLIGSMYTKYMHLVYGLCLKYFKEREKSKDATMQIFQVVAEQLKTHEVVNFKSWLYVVAKNHCLMELRKESRAIKNMDAWAIEEKQIMEKGFQLHPIDEDNAQLNKALEQCIQRLEEDQQKSVRLFYYKNKCYRDIAEILKVEEKKVKSLLQNGKRNLKICLDRKDVRS